MGELLGHTGSHPLPWGAARTRLGLHGRAHRPSGAAEEIGQQLLWPWRPGSDHSARDGNPERWTSCELADVQRFLPDW